jgi:hypothetical protein
MDPGSESPTDKVNLHVSIALLRLLANHKPFVARILQKQHL